MTVEAPHHGRAALTAQGSLAALLAALLGAFVYGSFAAPGSTAATWLPIAVALGAASSCALRAVVKPVDRGAWAIFAAAIAVWTVGSAYEVLIIRHLDPIPHPNLSDACRVAFYPLAYIGMVQLIRGRVTRFAAALWLDGLIGALAVGAVATGIVLPPALEGENDGLTPLILKLILPLGDMLLLAFVAGVMALNMWRPGRAWVVLGVGFGMNALAHALNLSQTTDAGSSGIVDVIWPVGIALIGFGAWHTSTLRPHLRLEGWGLLVAPTLFGWVTVGLVAYGNFERLGPLGLALAGLTLVLVMVRTGLTFKENMAIAHEMRQDVAESARDALTGLPNHRAFHEALEREHTNAEKQGHPLALVMFDVDELSLINERHGHKVGDDVITEVARRISATLRSEDLLARTGGEEFACVFPSTDGQAGWRAAERARRAVEDAPFDIVGEVTVSAGICDLATAGSAQELIRLAEGALYWSKIHGRNVVYRYTPEFMDVLSAEDRAVQAERSRTLSAITALARAVDAKDGNTQRHSERVGSVATEIAGVLGWSKERRAKLNEAGLVHDVGKIGVPDSILLKQGRLNPTETDIMEGHASLGAQIVQDVLGAEQVLWVLHHHERWDGAGYPAGVAAEAIPEGAQILAVADAWDAMTATRPYRDALAPESVIAELQRGSGTQWSPRAVGAIVALWNDNRITVGDANDHDEIPPLPPMPDAPEASTGTDDPPVEVGSSYL